MSADKISETAKSEGINLSEFMRKACMERLKRRENAETKYLRFSKGIAVDLPRKGFDSSLLGRWDIVVM
ncbi:MAG: hypothetical protein QXX41_12550 [Nitrososphaerota archaeon]